MYSLTVGIFFCCYTFCNLLLTILPLQTHSGCYIYILPNQQIFSKYSLLLTKCFCSQINTLASGWFWRFLQKKNNSFRLPYQRPSSSADCTRELFNGSNGLASL